ncbi:MULTISPECIES: TerD family protein [Bacillus]|uniref:Chemical-damaging agent resistance protein C n=2 Tax=Bacillus cereus TaxID=1396 RepID=A0A9X0MMA9_BACCE|nr:MULTISPECIES: TerD family protein [Bacillus cereus group]PEZ75400.1 chemical-damaging agent resistance protein C [Bacillus anthracis]KXY51251.1 chemical-damaging agent resistance protein C [Bacillus cereus]PES55187.1 chemical-damaging agent resistance protein C [Bacillus cereus]PFA29589.1 chemical-damaging agent resistance protein C [Bacillus thuringiensis]PFF45978.1 chemical-damaging agent resistance protein C [Bacillus cereus]
MVIQLQKGQKVDLTKGRENLKNVMIGLGWDVNEFDGGHDFDLDASAFLLNSAGKCAKDLDFIFYNNLKSTCGSVVHSGDNLTGGGDGDDEQLVVHLDKVPSNVDKIAFTVTIYDALKRNQNFGQVKNAFVRLVNQDTGEEIFRFDLGEDFSIETAVVFCELYRHNGEWKFNAVGAGFQGGLAALVKAYGLDA